MKNRFKLKDKIRHHSGDYICEVIYTDDDGCLVRREDNEKYWVTHEFLSFYEEYIEPKTYWVNVFNWGNYLSCGALHEDKISAESHGRGSKFYVKTIEIEV